MITIKEYAQKQNVSYEAIRKQLKRYASELEGHIIRQGRQQLLDDHAIEFLNTKRMENPIIVVNQENSEYIRELENKVAGLQAILAQRNEDLQEARNLADTRLLEASKVKYLEKDVERLEMALNRSENDIKQKDDELHLKNKEIDSKDLKIKELEKVVNKIKNKTLLQRIFKRWDD